MPKLKIEVEGYKARILYFIPLVTFIVGVIVGKYI